MSVPVNARSTIAAVGLVYFGIVAVIGVWATKRTRSASDFFVAGQGLGFVTLAIAAMAATLSGFAFIGGPGLVYSLGLGAVFIVLPAALTNSMGAWVLAKRLRLLAEVREMITIPDAIGARFQSPAARDCPPLPSSGRDQLHGHDLLALGLVVQATFRSAAPAIWIGTLIVLAYSVSGGILAGIPQRCLSGRADGHRLDHGVFFATEVPEA